MRHFDKPSRWTGVVGPGCEVPREHVEPWAGGAGVVGTAARDVDEASGVVRGVDPQRLRAEEAVSAWEQPITQSRAAHEVIEGAVLHVEHDEVVDLVLPCRACWRHHDKQMDEKEGEEEGHGQAYAR